MPAIPATINGVSVEFATTVGNDVDQHVIDGLSACIRKDIAPGHVLSSIYISSAFDSHQQPSRHAQQKAVDISRFNGLFVLGNFSNENSAVHSFVVAVQEAFENYPFRRENFGPYFKKKLGQAWSVGAHQDHIHLSVD
jgi:hypothetical protein